ncbi:UNVERIFIED_CONTAM: hypothetical protein FKN15_010865 [Acipenser sinensis]
MIPSRCRRFTLAKVFSSLHVKAGKRRKNKGKEKGVKDPETRELIKKKRNRNRQNRQDSKFWDLQIGYQTRQVTCTHKNGKPAALKYAWRTTEWSECRVDTLLSQQDRRRGNQTGLCGGGVQTREVYCVQGNEELLSYLNTLKEKEESQSESKQKPSVAPLLSITFEITASRPADTELCTGPVQNTTKLCHIVCPIECEVSSWTAWGPCTYENCEDQVGKKGDRSTKKQSRNRVIIQLPANGGQDCPEVLYEEKKCETSVCPGFRWKTHKWRRCQLVPWYVRQDSPGTHETCGPGLQTRGYIEEACIIPCPSDCKLSEWSNWSRCSKSCGSGVKVRSKWLREKPYNGGRPCPKLDHVNQPCSGTSTRARSAYPIRHPGEGRDCPSFTETEACSLNKNCYHYTYNVTGYILGTT